jgi:hypothetical protein
MNTAEYEPGIMTAEMAHERVAIAKVRAQKSGGRCSQQECLEDVSREYEDKLATIEGMLGGLALLRIGAGHGDGWIPDGMGAALADPFAAIEEILEAGRKGYAANVATLQAAIA